MRVLIALTYYRPHYSGLTIYTERLAHALTGRGHSVTVLTSRFNRGLPRDEIVNGVRVVRSTVRLHLSKGVIMPGMALKAGKLIREADVVNLHVPQMDAAYLSWMARAAGKPVVMTYHCDLRLPHGVVHRLANWGSELANHATARSAAAIVTNSRDYAENSVFLSRYLAKVRPVLPPIELGQIDQGQIAAFRQRIGLKPGQKVIGINARLASEKGVEYLVGAMPQILRRYPDARVLYVGQYENVLGEEAYARRLQPLFDSLDGHWTFLGVVSSADQIAFFNSCDVTVLPSINSTESYGMVQVESMFCGTPVVATNLPGVRHAVGNTGMGRIVPPQDSPALAQAILEVLDHPDRYRGDIPAVRRMYASETVAAQYESIFEELIAHP
jgi:glycosyltransferase involved in cell wall biosynthesis